MRSGISYDLAEKAAKLPMPDHSGDVGWLLAKTSREEIQLQLRRTRSYIYLAGVEEIPQVVTRDPVPAQNEVIPHVHIHRRYGQRLPERLPKA